jgi:hypothetical protein
VTYIFLVSMFFFVNKFGKRRKSKVILKLERVSIVEEIHGNDVNAVSCKQFSCALVNLVYYVHDILSKFDVFSFHGLSSG